MRFSKNLKGWLVWGITVGVFAIAGSNVFHHREMEAFIVVMFVLSVAIAVSFSIIERSGNK